MAASNYKVSNYIPDDLVFSILSKLPLKSFKRFGSVCKSWSLLFENPNFMNMYRINYISKNHAFYDDTSLLILQNKGYYYDEQIFGLYSISCDRFENRVKLDWPDPFQEDDEKGFIILGSCSINGILCLHSLFRWDFILWNPATKEFKIILHNPIESNPGHYFENCIFGYDSVRDDYKVIRHATIYSYPNGDLSGKPMGDASYDLSWEIYSLRSNNWKKLDDDVPKCSMDCAPIFLDGVGHWWSKLETDNEASLVSFDFSNEIFFTASIPSNIMGEHFDCRVRRMLLILNGSIALFVNYIETSTFHISILGEAGVRDSWTKLFVVGLLPCIQFPIGAWKNGDMFFNKHDNELVLFDLSTHMIEELGFINSKYKCGCQIVIYKVLMCN